MLNRAFNVAVYG